MQSPVPAYCEQVLVEISKPWECSLNGKAWRTGKSSYWLGNSSWILFSGFRIMVRPVYVCLFMVCGAWCKQRLRSLTVVSRGLSYCRLGLWGSVVSICMSSVYSVVLKICVGWAGNRATEVQIHTWTEVMDCTGVAPWRQTWGHAYQCHESA